MEKPNSNEKIIYLVRHGQSIANTMPVFQSPNSPLSEKGKIQAKMIADRVSNLNFETLIASPFQRAKETAETISSKTKKEIEFSEFFVERIKPSSVNEEVRGDEKTEDTWKEWNKSLYTPGIRVEDGENFDDITKRANKSLSFLENRSEKSILVVTHGFFLRVIIAQILLGNKISGETLHNLLKATSIENTGITVLKYNETEKERSPWELWIYNDHAHLAE